MKHRVFFCFLMVSFFVVILGVLKSSAQESPLYMYWTEAGWGQGTPKIQRANLDGSNVQNLITVNNFPIGIALDLAAGKMYWSDKNIADHLDPNAVNRILRANLDGSNIETLVASRSTPQSLHTYFDIALDTAAGKMYWTVWGEANDEDKIQRANLDGSNVETLVILPVEDPVYSGPRDIDLDLLQGKMYWTNTSTNKIRRANLDGTNVENVVTILDIPNSPHNIALDLSSSKIYWTECTSPGKIRRANLDGTNVENVVAFTEYPADIELDTLNGRMYWAGYTEGKIYRANLDGTNVEDITTGLVRPWGIALSIPQSSPVKLNFTTLSTVSTGDAFTAVLNIANAVDLAGAQFSLHFNPAVLEVTDIHEGDLLSGAGTFFQVEHFNSVPGEISGIRIARGSGVDGGGTLLKVDFKAKGTGVSTLEVRNLKLGNSTGVPFLYEVTSGKVEVKARPDVTGDGKVNILDLVRIARHFGPVSAASQSLDINGDGDIDILDLILVARHLGK